MKTKKFNRAGIHLPVRNLKETLAYYKDTLGFSDEWTFGETYGGIHRDDINLLFGENLAYTEVLNTSDNRLPVLWFVDNIEEIFKEFEQKGVSMADGIKAHPYGLTEFAFIDINGYYIRVAEETEK